MTSDRTETIITVVTQTGVQRWKEVEKVGLRRLNTSCEGGLCFLEEPRRSPDPANKSGNRRRVAMARDECNAIRERDKDMIKVGTLQV